MRRIVLGVLLFMVGAATVAALTRWHQPVESDEAGAAVVLSERNSPDPPLISQPPSVPASAAHLPRLSYVLKTTRSSKAGRQVSTESMTRSHDRVRMTLEDGQEWLFVQNTRYPTRVFGYSIDHKAREILLHEETTLRTEMGIRGWADVLTMRFDPAILGTLRDTGERRQMAGATATRFVSPDPARDGVTEVWWSEELLLPLSVTARKADVTVTSVVDGLTTDVDASLLADPDQRFPQYKSEDVADAHDH